MAYGALAMAIAMRGGQVPGVVCHTDQGSESTARPFQAACQRLGVTQSTGGLGSALHDAVIESWHSTLVRTPRSRALRHQASGPGKGGRLDLDYKTCRRHSTCQMMPQVTYEQTLAA